MQGDDADEAMRLAYPDWRECATGWPSSRGIRAMLDHLAQWDCESGEIYLWGGTNHGESMFHTRDHLMVWHVGLTYAALMRRVTLAQVRRYAPDLLTTL